MRSISTRTAAAGLAVAAAVALAGCASSGGSTAGSSTKASTASSAGAVNLAGVCPATVVVQTDWNPEADHGHLYEMVGPNPTVDPPASPSPCGLTSAVAGACPGPASGACASDATRVGGSAR